MRAILGMIETFDPNRTTRGNDIHSVHVSTGNRIKERPRRTCTSLFCPGG